MASDIDDNDDDSSDECVVIEKKRKYTGAFQYKTSFRNEWRKIWPFIAPVPGLSHEYRCQVCDKNLSCGHQGAADIRDHVSSQRHQALAKSLSTQPKLSFTPTDPLQEKVLAIYLPL